MFRLTWRLQRTGLIGMSAFGIFYGIFQAAAYDSAAGTTAAARRAFGQSMETFGRQYSLFLPLPHGVDTIAGYIQWRVYGALPILFGFWALLSAAGATRGDEERGLVEQWLAAGVGRRRYLVTRFIGFAIAAVIAIALTSAAIDAGAAGAGSALPTGPLLEVSVALLGLTLVVYALTTVVAQLTVSRGAAAGLAGLVVGVMFFVNGLSRSVESLKPLAQAISPFYYYDRTQPLSPGGTFDVAATAALFVAAVVFASLAVWFMSVRDIGAALIRLPARPRPFTDRPSPNPLLRMPVLASLYEQRIAVLAWALGAAFFAFYLASVGRQTVDLIQGSAGFRNYLTVAGHGNPYVALTGFFWFGIALLLLAVYAITQVARWSADDNEGRLEMILSAPVSRTRVVIERAVALTLRLAIIIAISSVALYLGAAAANIHFDVGALTIASLVLIPFGLSFAAIGAVLASRAPRATVAVLVTFTFLSYLITQLGPLLKWPDWALKLSVFNLYGAPLTSGVDWTGLWIMSAITIGGFIVGALLMQRRDVGS
ncbi:MAG TPA: ABC transporter permease subunit [Candidatus Dormibacteraeota bacterium]|nr:ABC transporter permease subunit [Candidatus Dormibacteraeota bacterium]